MLDNAGVQFAILIIAVTAGLLLEKLLVSYLPDDGILGGIKKAVASL